MGYILIINKVNGQNIQNPTVISPTKHIYISQKRTVLFLPCGNISTLGTLRLLL